MSPLTFFGPIAIMAIIIIGYKFYANKRQKQIKDEAERVVKVENYLKQINEYVDLSNKNKNDYELADKYIKFAISTCQEAAYFAEKQLRVSKDINYWSNRSITFTDSLIRLERDWNDIKAKRAKVGKLPTSKVDRTFWKGVLSRGLTKSEDANSNDVKVWRGAYKRLCSLNHPDKGGTDRNMAIINKAYKQAKEDIEFFGNQSW